MRLERFGLELGMKLTAQEPRMVGLLHDFHVGAVRRMSGDTHTGSHKPLLVIAVELVAVPVALADFSRAIGPVGKRAWFDSARPRAQAHRAAHLVDAEQFAQL